MPFFIFSIFEKAHTVCKVGKYILYYPKKITFID